MTVTTLSRTNCHSLMTVKMMRMLEEVAGRVVPVMTMVELEIALAALFTRFALIPSANTPTLEVTL